MNWSVVLLILAAVLALYLLKGKRNLFDINRMIAVSHVRAEQTKGLFLAQAKLILVMLSGAMLFMGVTLAATNIKFVWSIDTFHELIVALPVAFVAFLFAVCIEGGTLLSASVVKETERKIRQELGLLDKVRGRFTEEECEEREKKIKWQRVTPLAIMVACVFFSVCGAEIFWQKILESQATLFHVIGYILGLVCSSLLLFFEFKEETVQRVIEQCISSNALIQLALDQSAKSQIHDKLFQARREKLNTPEFVKVVEQAAEHGLYGVLTDSIEMTGITVSKEQLQREVEDRKEERAVASEFLSSGGQEDGLAKQLPGPTLVSSNGRNTDQRKAVKSLLTKYGRRRIMEDYGRYAQEAGISEKTLKRWLNTESA